MSPGFVKFVKFTTAFVSTVAVLLGIAVMVAGTIQYFKGDW